MIEHAHTFGMPCPVAGCRWPSPTGSVVITEVPIEHTPFGGESTSARLRRVEQERDELRAKLAAPCGTCHPCDAYGAEQDRDAALAHANILGDGLTRVTAELASARTELEQRRTFMADLVSQPGWIVARDGGRECRTCHREITRGEAYELVALSDTQHVWCPINNGQETP